ncbi:hypothetical protein KUV74_00425 [Halomonas sp. DP1Y21-3]|uniref:hypothetical protein n=1 Tax=Halomonas sp. DP1Y21-3 TaxID=2859080 RepID=UPI001C9528DB|nr:hypothetical protein [Halomonas sp. DP1Y21-3]MBY6108861.1 hypothetical protein [Halomonas sp. DP1Y21-3]
MPLGICQPETLTCRGGAAQPSRQHRVGTLARILANIMASIVIRAADRRHRESQRAAEVMSR